MTDLWPPPALIGAVRCGNDVVDLVLRKLVPEEWAGTVVKHGRLFFGETLVLTGEICW